jgi:hypothetical protein
MSCCASVNQIIRTIPLVSALRTLATAGHTFCIASQTISEFLAVATRSVADRGLGMDHAQADGELTKVTQSLEILYDTKAVVDELRRLVVLHSVSGKSVHDTRLGYQAGRGDERQRGFTSVDDQHTRL